MNNRNATLGQEQDISSIVREWTGQVRTSTTPYHSQRAVLTHPRILSSNPQAQIAVSPAIQTTQSKSINPSESNFAITLRMFFEKNGWEFREEYEIKKSGKRIDFCVKAPYQDGHIFFGVECKRDLNDATNATVLADHFEQAVAYSRSLNMPVFLAPVMTQYSQSSLYAGGHKLRAMSALAVFGGRCNVGLLAINRSVWQNKVSVNTYMILRGGSFWNEQDGFNPQRMQMVTSTGSSKDREDIKIWR